MDYKVGDMVVLSTNMPLNWCTEMKSYLGAVVQIAGIYNGVHFSFDGDGGWNYKLSEIDRIATEEDIIKANIEKETKRAAEAEAIRKKYRGCTYLPEDVQKIAVSIFGEDRVDLEVEDDRRYNITILFPEIFITNSREQKHTIKDLYVRFTVGLSSKIDTVYKANIGFQGMRGKYSLKEFDSSYSHSHLPRGSHYFTEFCIGSSDYTLILQGLRLSMTESAWYGAFLALENYVKWESLEGGPYISIGSISYRRQLEEKTLVKEIKKFIEYTPRECLGFNNGIEVIRNHPEFYKCVNEFSSIKTSSLYSKEELKSIKDNAKEVLKNNQIMWKEKEITPIAEIESNGENEYVSPELVDRYGDIINNFGKKYIKIYQHERKRQDRREKVFGKTGA